MRHQLELKAILESNPQLKSYRWKRFFEHHVIPGTPLEALLRAVRKGSRNNSGNPNARGKTKAEKVIYTMGWEELKREHEPREGEEYGMSFWIREKNDPKLPPVDSVFPGKREDGKTRVIHLLRKFQRGYTHLRCTRVKYRGVGIRVGDFMLSI